MKIDVLISRLIEIRKECDNVEVLFYNEDGLYHCYIGGVQFPNEEEDEGGNEIIDKGQVLIVGCE